MEWNHYACVMDIPSEADVMNMETVSGTGQLWLGECEFEEVGKDVPVNGLVLTGAKNLRPGRRI